VKIDIRDDAAKFYDLNPDFPLDVPFYLNMLPSAGAAVLELGCGTGRVTAAIAPHCGFIHGMDLSPAMAEICRSRLAGLNLPPGKTAVSIGDISDFDLERNFDLIIAPFRVLQNLESTVEVNGLLECVCRHLKPGGTCILNVFNPFCSPDKLQDLWLIPGETLNWEVPVEGGKAACYDRRIRIDAEQLIIYPDLIYRRYKDSVLAEEAILHLAMRCYYPDTFEHLIIDHEFQIVNRWGGYQGEKYGEGPELVLQFKIRS
jgi:SAM-dependent methyltransferase